MLLDIGGVKYPMTKGEDGVWTGVSNAQDEGFHMGYQEGITDAGDAHRASLSAAVGEVIS